MIGFMKLLAFSALALSLAGCVSTNMPPRESMEEARKRIRADISQHKASMTRMLEIEASATQKAIAAEGEDSTIEKIKRDSIVYYKDPDSVLFRDLKLVKFGDGKLLCGSLNAKNGFGAYVGYQQFLASTIRMHLPRKDERFAATTAGMIRRICM